jgi:hypothetical protein
LIYEYAVEPALVAEWARTQTIGLAPQFGLDHRRVVSDFPFNWEGEVTGTLLESFGDDASDPDYIAAQNYLSILLDYMTSHMPDRQYTSTSKPWVDQALAVHSAEPFHAILARKEIVGQARVITPEVVHILRDTRWYLPTVNLTAKTAYALAGQLEPLLRTAKQIVLVDPYFKPAYSTYSKVLELILEHAIKGRAPGRSFPDFTILAGVGDRDPVARGLSVQTQLQNEASHRCKSASDHLGAFIPMGMSVKFQCISEKQSGDSVHNRYLLTDMGGACIPYGTEEIGDHVFDDITPLFSGQYRSRWRQYGKGEGIQEIGSAVTVLGTKV